MVSVIVSLMDGHRPLRTVDVTAMPVGGIARPSHGKTHRLEQHRRKLFFKKKNVVIVCVCMCVHACVSVQD